MNIEMYFNTKDKVFRFPVIPSELMRDINSNFDREVVQGLGEVAVFNNNALAEITIDCFFPRENSYYASYPNYPSPAECVGHFKELKNKGIEGRFIFTGGYENINQEMYIESFSYGHQTVKGINYTIKLVECRRIELPTTPPPTQNNNNATNNARPTSPPTTSKIYKVQLGDSLYSIAIKMYGDGKKWTKIRDANTTKYPSLKRDNTIYSKPPKAMELIIP